MKSQTYAEYVTAQSRQNPSLENLCHFLKRDTFTQPCRISCLEFNNESDSPSRKDLDIESLACLLSGNHETSDLSATMNRPKGRILIVEDLTRAIVEALGEALDIDPMFFASHIDGEKISADSSIPSMVQLPSQVKTRSFLTLRYHRVLKFGDEAAGLRRLESTGNILRKTMILPPNSANAYIGLAQRCCSVVMTSSQRAGWTGLILVDAPINTKYRSSTQEMSLEPRLFLGGFEDFLSPSSFLENETRQLERLSHLEDLVVYWTKTRPPGFDPNSPSLLSLAYHPLRIVAAEWVVYMGLLSRTVRQYEYSTTTSVENGTLAKLDLDLRALQVWTRRCTQSSTKLRFAVMFIESKNLAGTDKEGYDMVREDYKHLAAMVERYSDLLDNKIQVVTSMVQIIDSRRSLKEARNVTRLTNLALLFIPMSFVTGLLGMNDHIPTQALIWFFGLAVPGCMIVFFVAHLPEMRSSLLAERIRRFKDPLMKV